MEKEKIMQKGKIVEKGKITTKFDSINLEMTLLEKQKYFDLFSFPYRNNAILPDLTRLLDFCFVLQRCKMTKTIVISIFDHQASLSC